MSASDIDWDSQIDKFMEQSGITTEDKATDRQLLLAIYKSQVETERLVREFIATVQPTVEKFSRGGILGMLGH